MNLKVRCQYCSESKEVECNNMHSASGRCDAVRSNGWIAYQADGSGLPVYYCCSSCEQKHKVQTKTHLKVIGSITR